MAIDQNYQLIKSSLPGSVVLVLAAKTRTKQEIEEAIATGATDIGYNYVQEAEDMYRQLGEKSKKLTWHLIGHLQTNKVKKALEIFDVIQTVDSYKLAREIDKRTDKIIPVYIEVRISEEETKYGVEPDNLKQLIQQLSTLHNIKIQGLMGMEPYFENPEHARPYFRKMKSLFDEIKQLHQPNLDLKVLSMGMSTAYKIAVEEGSNMVRIGTAVFGERKS